MKSQIKGDSVTLCDQAPHHVHASLLAIGAGSKEGRVGDSIEAGVPAKGSIGRSGASVGSGESVVTP